jgi:glycerol-3-phosphate dehydrogenase (NAD(P)+)
MDRTDEIQRIAVIGAGAWGTALAATAAAAGRDVTLWAFETEVADAVARDHRNEVFLPGIDLPAAIAATADLAAAVAGADAVLLVVPSQFLRPICTQLATALAPGVPVCIAAKGIERDTGNLMSDIVAGTLPGHPVAALSGPSFAGEVARGQPTAVTIASADAAADQDSAVDGDGSLAARLARALGTPAFRPYVARDIVGVEVGGAVKNVIAIACGIAAGLGFGSNTRALLITRGLEEMKRLATSLGGERETLSGLSGMGDLTLTCSSEQSRNFSFGLALGRGESAEEILGRSRAVVEGAENALTVTDLARRKGVEMPICEAVRAVVHGGVPLDRAMDALMRRPLRAE